MLELSTDNLLSWLGQVFVIASLGALLPFVFRIRHPRSRLTYCHAVLAACVLLPLIQPWQHSLVVVNSNVIQNSMPPDAGVAWGRIVPLAIAAGIAAKLIWLLIGFWQLRRFRRAAVAVRPIPQSIRDARHLTRTDARFCISADVSGPAALGYVDPVILLPESFLSLDEGAQRGIACHELLHVQRKDWLITVMEELIGSLLWFQPAVWSLLAQARLSREQLVDAEVVRLTAAPGAYIHALLSIAAAPRRLKIAPAALFFTRRQLTQRMTSLLAETGMSTINLICSYGLMALLLAAAAGAVFSWFPMIGQADFVAMASPAPHPSLPQPSRRGPATAGMSPKEFTIKVTPPDTSRAMSWRIVRLEPAGDPNIDVFYYPNVGPDPRSGWSLALPPPLPPPPPPPPQARLGGLAGVGAIRPGDVFSAEEIERFLAAVPPTQLVEITQDAEGRVKKLVITRHQITGRFPDEIDFVPSGTDIGPVHTDATASAGTADGID